MALKDHRRRALQRALREARQAAGLTQVEVAQRLRQPQSYVSKFEAGTRRLDLVELVTVCAVLGVGIQSLVDIIEKEPTRDEG